MALRNTSENYGSMAKALHWIAFLMIATLLIVGFIMGDLEKPFRFTVYNIHKLTGLTVLILMLFRVFWTLTNPRLSYPNTIPSWQIMAAKSIHILLYVLAIAMPLSGWIMSTAAGHNPNLFGLALRFPFIAESKALAKFASNTHEIIAWVIIVTVSLHILAALKHYFINKDNILQRMLPFN